MLSSGNGTGCLELDAPSLKSNKMTKYSDKYDTYYNPETGEWLEKIGFCEPGECTYCDAYYADGSPKTAFDAPEDAL